PHRTRSARWRRRSGSAAPPPRPTRPPTPAPRGRRRRRPSRPCSRALTPRRSRETRLPGRQLLGPDDNLLAVLPLEHQRLVRDLDPIPIDPEPAEDGVAVHLENGVAEFPAVQRPGAPDGLDDNLAAAVPGRGVIGEIGAGELL